MTDSNTTVLPAFLSRQRERNGLSSNVAERRIAAPARRTWKFDCVD
jgi:hypothetical protein